MQFGIGLVWGDFPHTENVRCVLPAVVKGLGGRVGVLWSRCTLWLSGFRAMRERFCSVCEREKMLVLSHTLLIAAVFCLAGMTVWICFWGAGFA